VIVFDGSCGTEAAGDTLGGYAMTSFDDDTRTTGVEEGRVITPSGDDLVFSEALEHVEVGSGWATWSHDFTGDVYIVPGGVMLTLTLPAGTLAFSFFAEPNDFDLLDITATAQDGTSSGPVGVEGDSGATFFGFYTTDPETPLECIEVSIDNSGGFAIGEFAINQDPESVGEPAPVCGEVGE
jgi:hypothetical protein